MTPRSILLLAIAIIFSLTRTIAAADAPCFIINGTAQWDLYNSFGNRQSNSSPYKFQILTSPAGWKMSITRDNPPTSRQLGSDDFKLYEYYDASALKDTAPLDPKFLAAHGIDPHIKTYYNGASIENGHFPTHSGKEAQILWLAFFYPHYYATLHETNPIIISQISYQVIARHPRMTIDTDDISALPNHLQFFSPGKYILRDYETNLPPPLDQGYLLWDSQILTTTNIAGQILPLTAQYQQFYPQSGTNGVALSRGLHVTITVDNITRAQGFAPYFFQPTITNELVHLSNYAPEYPPDADPAQINTGLVTGTLHNGQWPKPKPSK